MPQRVVHPQTGARYVSEGGRGVIPAAQAVGVIPRLYFISRRLPSGALGNVRCNALNDAETVRLGKGWTGVITCLRAYEPVTPGFVIWDERLICKMIF